MKMSDAEIIKAFEERTQKAEHPGFILCGQIIDLINRLKAENKKNENIIRIADKTIETQNAEIERLESLCEKIGIANDAKFERICVLQEDLETAKSEARKEFWDKLKSRSRKMQSSDWSGDFYDIAVLVEDGDNLLKEMGCE